MRDVIERICQNSTRGAVTEVMRKTASKSSNRALRASLTMPFFGQYDSAEFKVYREVRSHLVLTESSKS